MSIFSLRPVPPFRLDLTAWSLRRLPINEIDCWDGETYRRVLIFKGKPVEVSITQTKPPDDPEISITTSTEVDEVEISTAINKLLGLQVDLSPFYEVARSNDRLWSLVDRFRGFKPPRFPSVFEAVTNGISCQQLSLVVGITLLDRLTANYGLAVGDHHAFPRPEDLLTASVENLRALGYSGRKAQNILAIALAITSGELDLEALNDLDDSSAITSLCNIYGIGRWTAEYVALRGLGRMNIFPADDVGAQTRLKEWAASSERPTYEGIHSLIDQFAPYRGLIYFHLFLSKIDQKGLLK